jgi:hypothetical protein
MSLGSLAKSADFQAFKSEKMPKNEFLGPKIIHILRRESIGPRDTLSGKNLGVRRSILYRNAKNLDKTAKKLGQNACPIGVARKNVSRIVLRTSRESVYKRPTVAMASKIVPVRAVFTRKPAE